MKKRMINKKGISPLVATVLLIGFTVALVVLIIVWGRTFTMEQAQKQEALSDAKLKCQAVSFTVLSAPGGDGVINLKNQENTKIDDFVFRLHEKTKGGSESTETKTAIFDSSLENNLVKVQGGKAVLEGFATGKVSIGMFSNIEKIDIIPHILAGGNHYVPCTEQMKAVRPLL